MSYNPNFRGNTAKATLFLSGSANPATTGLVRLGYNETISWRNDNNTGNAGLVYRAVAGFPPGFDAFQFLDDTGVPNAAVIVTNGDNEGFFGAGLFGQGDQFLNGAAVTISGNVVDTGFASSQNDTASNNAHAFRAQTWSNNALGRNFSFLKSRGTAVSPIIVNNNDVIGSIISYGYDGVDFKPSAMIQFLANNTPGAGNMPGAITFYTTPDSSVTPGLALAINRNKQASFFGGGIASSSGVRVAGAPFTGGTSTTTKPLVLIENAGNSNSWSTAGTALGINPLVGFAGNLIDAQVNSSFRFNVDSTGVVTSVSRFTSTATGTNARFTGGTGSATATSVSTFVGSFPFSFLTTDNSDGPGAYGSVLYSNTNTDSASFDGFRARGTFASPLIVQDNDKLAEFYGWGWDGAVFGQGAGVRIEADGAQALGSTPGRFVIRTTPTGFQFSERALSVNADKSTTFYGHALPSADGTLDLGSSANKWRDLYISDASIRMGTIPASTGAIRLPSSAAIKWRSVSDAFDNSISIINNTVLPSLPAGTNIFKFNSVPGFDAAVVQAGDPEVRGVFYGSDFRAVFQYFATDQTILDNINLHGGTKEYAHLSISDSTGQTPAGGFGHLHVEDVTDGGKITLAKARGASTSALTIVQSGDELGNITAAGYDGVDFEPSAVISFGVDGTPGSNDMPGNIVFKTTPDGSITPAEALRISSDKSVLLSGNGAASVPNLKDKGTWFTGGDATTTKPHWLIEPSGTTSTNWNTSGTGFGINAASGFAGNLIDAQVNAVAKFKVDNAGKITQASSATLFSERVALQTFTLADNQVAAATIYSVVSASFVALFIDYSVVRNGIVKTGTIRIANDGSATPGIDDQGASTGAIGITFSTTVSGANLLLQYTSTSTGFTGTMHFEVKQWG